MSLGHGSSMYYFNSIPEIISFYMELQKTKACTEELSKLRKKLEANLLEIAITHTKRSLEKRRVFT